jgi:formamidopyrimidine-DNA glycosylase
MPELPELQAHAERLERELTGAVLSGFRALSFTALKTYQPAPEEAVGHPVARIWRRGKLLLLEVGPVTFVVHLMQGGRLRPEAKPAAKPRGGVARWSFEDGRHLLLTEPGTERRAGVWVVAGDPLAQPPLDDLGPDADQLDRAGWAAVLAGRTGRLHGVLRDQQAVAGIGRRLANEVCHRARLSPFASAAKLGDDEVDRLAAAVSACIAETLAEERERDELVRSAERTSSVHGHAGDPCPVCGDTVRSVEYRAYTVAYCATCQTGGRVLADNTTSKFVK